MPQCVFYKKKQFELIIRDLFKRIIAKVKVAGVLSSYREENHFHSEMGLQVAQVMWKDFSLL